MTGPTDPILYSFRRCPYAIRARLALAVSGTRGELREVKLSAKPQAMLDASPKGTVPVLVLPGGTMLDESLDIMRWALAKRDPEGWLTRDDAALIAMNDGPFKHDLDRFKYPERHGADPRAHQRKRPGVPARARRSSRRCGPALRACPRADGRCDHAFRAAVRSYRPGMVQRSTITPSQALAGRSLGLRIVRDDHAAVNDLVAG